MTSSSMFVCTEYFLTMKALNPTSSSLYEVLQSTPQGVKNLELLENLLISFGCYYFKY